MISPNRSEIVIRRARAEDAQFLEKLYISVRKAEFAHLGWEADQIEMLLKIQFGAQMQGYRTQFPAMRNFLITADGEAVGKLSVTDEIRLVDIAVLPESRNLGIGSFVLRRLAAKADGDDKDIFLQVLKTNGTAFRLYERFGFETIDQDELYLKMRRKNVSLRQNKFTSKENLSVMQTIAYRDYADKINTNFRVAGQEPALDLFLIEAARSQTARDDESFALLFRGAKDRFLPQGLYDLEHESLAGGGLFLVPVGEDERGFLYEAVFNHLKL